MLNIVAVQVGNYLSCGELYVAKLFDGIRRHMPKGVDYRLACFTDGSAPLPPDVIAKGIPLGVTGWWAKLCAFKPGAFVPGERVLYFDLDVLPVGDLSDFAGYAGKFAAMSDPFFPEHLNSSIMAWEAGALDHVWTTWDEGGRPQFDRRGDQHWIETMQPIADRWQRMFPGQAVSFKVDCWLQGRIPDNARVIVHHGHPRPHETKAAFIEEIWRQPLVLREDEFSWA